MVERWGKARRKEKSLDVLDRLDRGRSLDFLVHGGAVAVGAEFLQFQPFAGVAAVLLGGVTRHTRRPLGGVGPAFGALESDHDPDALVFCHGKDVRR
jgi:hypothetical protein